MVQKFYCDRYLFIQSMLGKKKKKKLTFDNFWLTRALGCFSKDTLKKIKMSTPPHNWGVPRKIISRRKDWSNKSRGSALTLKVWQKTARWRNQRRRWNLYDKCYWRCFRWKALALGVILRCVWAMWDLRFRSYKGFLIISTWPKLNLQDTAT